MKYLVGMSGGVDSSVCAALLRDGVTDVVGCTLKMFDSPRSEAAVSDAKKVADFLKIKHVVIDCRKDFKTHVIDYFVSAYKKGLTPNPCIMCNEFVKFYWLEKVRQKYSADFMTTGHYAKVVKDADTVALRQARDLSKDQSYFLHRLNQNVLKKVLFPLGNFLKSEVREIAKNYGLPVFDKSESQDVCFIETGDYVSFIKKDCADMTGSGNIVDEFGKIVGHHNGIINYTVGQRKGLGLSGGPFFVKEICPELNTILVTNKVGVKVNQIKLKDVKYINNEYLGECEVKIRSANKRKKAKVIKVLNEYIVQLYSDEYGVAKGQHCVFYLDDLVLGGGIIC